MSAAAMAAGAKLRVPLIRERVGLLTAAFWVALLLFRSRLVSDLWIVSIVRAGIARVASQEGTAGGAGLDVALVLARFQFA
eukprot:5331428-Pleurochrysis_carterae.AAC.1